MIFLNYLAKFEKYLKKNRLDTPKYADVAKLMHPSLQYRHETCLFQEKYYFNKYFSNNAILPKK
jgi:hypothetical protein